MRTNRMHLEARGKVAAFAQTFLPLVLLGLLPVVSLATLSVAADAPPTTFASPAEAVGALFEAAKKQDEQALEAILGAGKEVTSSSDEVEDKLEREQFSRKYEEMHRLVQEPDGSTVLYVGAENWPFPIPLVSKNGKWYFDSDQGKQEILFRRIGENEATAIQVCEEFAMANTAADAKAASEDPITRFAQTLASSNPVNADNNESNLFHGYYFRIMLQNPAPATTSRGKKARGLKLVAYPAQYHSSGVKTFVVTWRGIVFEKDLGPETPTVAPQMKARSGSNWHPTA
ncbi:MAG TPA: DUF2950 family protein [Candidatus Sulfotelmatobacter sp.]|nr:DUF2950 family protein [Candidatus Sulfotelmatobacter sp.]